MEQTMSIAEIEESFRSEWILVEDPQTDEEQQFRSGKVIAHSKDRDEVYRKAAALHLKRFAILFTGKIPKDSAIVL